MKHIYKVHVFHSNINRLDGDNLGSGFAVIIEPTPKTDYEAWQIAQKISNALDGLPLGED